MAKAGPSPPSAEELARRATEPKWERVIGGCDQLHRVEVPGGWLYRTTNGRIHVTAVALCFVPKRDDAVEVKGLCHDILDKFE